MMLYQCCILYETVFEADTDTLPLPHEAETGEENYSTGYEMGGSNTATCLMPSDVISLLHSL